MRTKYPAAIFSGQKHRVLQRLTEKIHAIEDDGRKKGSGTFHVLTRWPVVDQAYGGIARGAIHEWFGVADGGRHFRPPLFILAHLAQQSLEQSKPFSACGRRCVLWIGRTVWPYAHILAGAPNQGVPIKRGSGRGAGRWEGLLLRHSIFVDPPNKTVRLWAIDLALRSTAVCAVVADGSDFDMAATRRLQLAAESSGTIGLLARPHGELANLSVAATRWLVRLEPAENPRWRLEMVRSRHGTRRREAKDYGKITARNASKALPPQLLETPLRTPDFIGVPSRLLLELDRATGLIALPAKVADRSDTSNAAPQRRQTA